MWVNDVEKGAIWVYTTEDLLRCFDFATITCIESEANEFAYSISDKKDYYFRGSLNSYEEQIYLREAILLMIPKELRAFANISFELYTQHIQELNISINCEGNNHEYLSKYRIKLYLSRFDLDGKVLLTSWNKDGYKYKFFKTAKNAISESEVLLLPQYFPTDAEKRYPHVYPCISKEIPLSELKKLLIDNVE